MIVVTGGCGFIGSNLVKKISRLGLGEIYIVDQQEKILQKKQELAPFVEQFIDYQSFIQNLNILKEGDVVYHQGACTDTMNYDCLEMMFKNFEYSKVLFDFCYRNNIRLIYASSAAVYGLGKNGFREELECERPINLYAKSKLLFDNYVRCFEPRSQILGLRYFNVYGPGESHKGKMASTILQFFNQIKEEEIVRPFQGSEDFLRDFIFVEDVVNVNLFFLHRSETSGIFNCGSGNPQSFVEIIKHLKNHYKFDIIEKEMPAGLKEKYQTFTKADLSNLQNAGYRFSFTTLENGIKKYLEVLENCQK
jgi:ADP-L-glycero-D-manno-heptose 6-epimerase